MAHKYNPDLDQAARFLRILDPTADCRSMIDGKPDGFTFQTFDDVKNRKDGSLAQIFQGELDTFTGRLTALNHRDAGVFVAINETDMQGRKSSNITRVRAIWIEDDNGLDIPLPLEPHLISETSPNKFHKIFLVEGASFENHSYLQSVLVEHFGSDNGAKDLPRVLRVPGFYHCKTKPFQVRLLHESSTPPYPIKQVLEAFSTYPVTGKPINSKTTTSWAKVNGTEYTPLTGQEWKNVVLPDITIDNAEKYLPVPGEQSRSEWLDVGIILYNQFSGSDEALEIFDRWSSGVRAYDSFEDVERTWHSFSSDRPTEKTKTFRSLIEAYNKNVAAEKKTYDIRAVEKAKKLLDECDDPYVLTRDIAPKLCFLAGGTVTLEKEFRKKLMDKYAELRPGEKLSLTEAAKAFKTKPKNKYEKESPGLFYVDARAPWWAANWVWVACEDKFYRTGTGTSCSSRGFDGLYNCFLPKGEDAPISAAAFARNNFYVGRAVKRRYMPDLGTMFEFTGEGEACMNSYSSLGVPEVPKTLSSQNEKNAASLIENHIGLLCGGWNREAILLCNFLAHCFKRQIFPDAPNGKFIKIRWAMLIIGEEGGGKSTLGDLLARALGPRNTKRINGNAIASGALSGFNDWIEGHQMGIIEEIKWQGHNRHEITNSLKPIITNSVVSCHKKHESVYDIHNTANYLLFSNHDDGLPLQDGDRRYCIIKSLFPLKKMTAEDKDDYFTKLHTCIQGDSVGAMMRFLLDVPVHSDFKINGPAPSTQAKLDTIQSVKDDLSDLIKEIIEDDKNPLFSEEAVCFTPLFKRVMASEHFHGDRDRDRDKLSYRFTKALKDLGYSNRKRLRIDGEGQQLWTKTIDGVPMSGEDAKALMEGRLSAIKNEEGLH
jgi:Family of unknown function (DUF5906)/Primase C terminal 2 (PriCT-2)/RepB DNA-primase from phage plasmid